MKKDLVWISNWQCLLFKMTSVISSSGLLGGESWIAFTETDGFSCTPLFVGRVFGFFTTYLHDLTFDTTCWTNYVTILVLWMVMFSVASITFDLNRSRIIIMFIIIDWPVIMNIFWPWFLVNVEMCLMTSTWRMPSNFLVWHSVASALSVIFCSVESHSDSKLHYKASSHNPHTTRSRNIRSGMFTKNYKNYANFQISAT